MNDPIALSSPSLSPVSAPSTPIRTRWPLYLSAGLLLSGVSGAGIAVGAYSGWKSSSLIAPGVSVAGVEVGGLSKSAASERLKARFGQLPLKLTAGGTGLETTLAELGGKPSFDFSVAKAAKIGRENHTLANILRVYGSKAAGESLMLPITWDKTALLATLREWDKTYAAKPVDARLEFDGSGIRVVREQKGRSLNIGATAKAIQTSYFVGTHALKAYTREIAPRISAADLRGQDVLLATYPTRFDAGLRGRTANIRVACAAIDGHVLMPGQSFSFNGMTGQRTWNKGYRMAHIFETKPGAKEAEVVDGLAGGVCQVSSTLYNAVRRANEKVGEKGIEILERNSHSLPVNYVPSGLDATVAWPSKDFRFKNTFSHPIWIRTTVRRSKLTIGVWGRVPVGETQVAATDLNAASTPEN